MKSNVIKRCSSCGRFLSIDDFYWSNKKKGYKRFDCKKCSKNNLVLWHEKHPKYYKNQKERIKQYCIINKEQIKKRKKQYRINNKEKIIQYNKQYRKDNKKRRKENYKQWSIKNPEKVAAINASYRSSKLSQTPKLNKEEQKRIDRLYEIRDLLNHDKVDFHVDHIQPISKGGLHHPDNLQILPNWLNQEKCNKWPLTEAEEIKYEGFKL